MENRLETAIELTQKLRKYRFTAMNFFRENYQERVKPYSHIIQEVMKANNMEAIPALLKVAKTGTFKEAGPMSMVLFFAGTCEVILKQEETETENEKP